VSAEAKYDRNNNSRTMMFGFATAGLFSASAAIMAAVAWQQELLAKK
jgi:hypothetical protein